MQIMSPNEIKQFDWSSEKDLPQENAATSLSSPEPQLEPAPASVPEESAPTE
jgi:hypothetical protein